MAGMSDESWSHREDTEDAARGRDREKYLDSPLLLFSNLLPVPPMLYPGVTQMIEESEKGVLGSAPL